MAPLVRECKASNLQRQSARSSTLAANSVGRSRSMKSFFALCGLLCLMAIPACAQNPAPSQNPTSSSSSSSQEEAQKTEAPREAPPPVVVAPYEISGGYNLRIFTQPNYSRINLNGGYGSFEYKILNRI